MLGSVRFGKVCWKHWFPNSVALKIPLKLDNVCGGRRRRSPTLITWYDASAEKTEQRK